jgi:hypothetical protein
MKEAFERMTGMPDAWTNPALMQARNGFIQGWEARAQHDVDATIIKYHEATIKRLEKRIEELAQPAQQEPVGVFCEDDDIGYVRLIPHQQMKLKAWDKLYTTPQQRPWVGLEDEDKETLILKHAPPLHPDYKDDSLHGLLQAVNDFLREHNT